MDYDKLEQLRISTNWLSIEVMDEPHVYLTFRGYAPALIVKSHQDDEIYKLYISAKSLGELIEPLREKNENKFKGLRFMIKKENNNKFAKYELLSNKELNRELNILRYSKSAQAKDDK